MNFRKISIDNAKQKLLNPHGNYQEETVRLLGKKKFKFIYFHDNYLHFHLERRAA